MADVRSVTIVTAFYPPSVGGIERYSSEFARVALASGMRVNVITTARITRPSYSVEDGIGILRLPAIFIPMQGGYFPIPIGGIAPMKKLLCCDIVIAQTRFFLTTALAAILARPRGAKICVFDHGSGPLRSSPVFSSASMLYERFITWCLKLCRPRFFAVSEASAGWLRAFGIPDAVVIPNAVRPPEEMPQRENWPWGRAVLFFGGRLIKEKGVLELVRAADLMVQDGYAIKLRIGGSGPLSGELRRLAQKRKFLTFLGELSPSDVADELKRANVFVNPSNYPEGLPTVLLEAGAAALPVVSTPQGGSSEVIHDGETGWIVPRGEPQDISTALRDVLLRPDEARRRGRALFTLIQDHYTWPAVLRKFLSSEGMEEPA